MMKKLNLFIFCAITNFVTAQSKFKVNTNTNVIVKGCYHEPCSVSKSLSVKVLSKTENETLLKLKLLGGSQGWDSKNIDWNKKPHEIVLRCSKTRPRINGEIINININDVAGYNYDTIDFYFVYCHSDNSKISVEDKIKKYNYNVIAK